MLAKYLLLALAAQLSLSEGVEHDGDRRDTYHTTSKPTVNSIALYNTVKWQKIGHVTDGQKIDICKLNSIGIHSPSQLAFRAWTSNTKSVDFDFNSKFYRRESVEPFTLCGDSGDNAYDGCTDLKYGHQCISATPHSLEDGKGTCGNKVTVCFVVVGCPAPVRAPVPVPAPVPLPTSVLPPPSVSSFELINTVNQDTIRTLTNGATIDICKLNSVGIHKPSQLNFRAVTVGHVESVQFSKNSAFFRNDNAAFYSLCGDNSGFPYYGCADLDFGYQCISAKPCTQDNAGGVCGRESQICFTIIGCPAPTRAPISAPTKSPINKPTMAPISAPTMAPINKPTMAPISAPTMAPINKPTMAPISAPTMAPINKPTMAPISAPTMAPINKPTMAPISAPTRSPINKPTRAPINKPTRAPVNRPTMAPISAPTIAPINPPVLPPVRAPVQDPVVAPRMLPVSAPVMAPVVAPVMLPVSAPVMTPAAAPVMGPIMPTACSALPLGAATPYNLYISGNVVEFRTSEGSVAIGGNANFTYSSHRTSASINGSLIVNGNLDTIMSGQIGGKLTVGGMNNAGSLFTAAGGVSMDTVIDFVMEKARLQLLSKTYAAYPVTGITSYNANGVIHLSCATGGLAVFTVDAVKLSNTTGVTINVARGTTVLINVISTAPKLHMQKFVTTITNNNIPLNNVLWNMPTVSILWLRTINFQGSILAPDATVNFKYGTFDGTIVGQSWVGDATGYDSPFTGCLPMV